jgi:hypothetical protein
LQTYAFTGNAANLSHSHLLSPVTGTFIYTTQDANLRYGRALTAGTGVFFKTEYDAQGYVGRKLISGTGALNLAGVVVTFVYDHPLRVETATFNENRIGAFLLVNRLVSAAPATFALTGFACEITISAAAEGPSNQITIEPFDGSAIGSVGVSFPTITISAAEGEATGTANVSVPLFNVNVVPLDGLGFGNGYLSAASAAAYTELLITLAATTNTVLDVNIADTNVTRVHASTVRIDVVPPTIVTSATRPVVSTKSQTSTSIAVKNKTQAVSSVRGIVSKTSLVQTTQATQAASTSSTTRVVSTIPAQSTVTGV